jgi:hypothetical protein
MAASGVSVGLCRVWGVAGGVSSVCFFGVADIVLFVGEAGLHSVLCFFV